MRKLQELLETEMTNIRASITDNNDFESEILLAKLSQFIDDYGDIEEIEYREYINSKEFYLYNILNGETTLYAERYDDSMTDDTYDDVIQESKCRAFNVDDVVDMIIGLYKFK